MGPNSFEGFPGGEVPATEMARAELCTELAENVQMMTAELTAAEIAADPALDAMMAKLIECGPALDPSIRSHLRKMVAWRIGGLIETGVQAGYDAEFFRMVENHVDDELAEMAEFEDDLSNVPDLWQLAYDDLVTLTQSSAVVDELENGYTDYGVDETYEEPEDSIEQLTDEFPDDEI